MHEREIFKHLRTVKKATAEEIAAAIGKDVVEVKATLADIESRHAIRIDSNGKVTSLMPIHSIGRTRGPKMGKPFRLPARVAGNGSLVKVAPTIDPNDLAPRDQGNVGDCVGEAFSQYGDAVACMLAGDIPTTADKAQYQVNVRDANGVLLDILFYQTKSTFCIYTESRVVAGIQNDPEDGSYDWAAAQAWIQNGQCFEDQWPTSKDDALVYTNPPSSAVVSAEIPRHRAVSYTQLLPSGDKNQVPVTQAAIQAAIDAVGYCAIGILVFENYTQMAGGNGDWLYPSGECAGGHELFCYGYDTQGVKILNSWGNVCGREGHLGWDYLQYIDATNGPANQGLTTVVVSQDIARRNEVNPVTEVLTCNVRANVYLVVNGAEQFLGTTPDTTVSGSFTPGTSYTFFVEAVNYNNLNQSFAETFSAAGTFEFQLTIPTPPTPTPNPFLELIEVFWEWLVNLF